MKNLLFVFLLFPTIVFGQVDTCFTQQEIIFMANQKLEYKAKIARQDSIIQLYKANVTLHKQKITYQDSLISLQARKIQFLEENNIYYKVELERKSKWWKDERIHFTLGFLAASIIAVLLNRN